MKPWNFDAVFCVRIGLFSAVTQGTAIHSYDDVGGLDLRLGFLENLEISIMASMVRVVLG